MFMNAQSLSNSHSLCTALSCQHMHKHNIFTVNLGLVDKSCVGVLSATVDGWVTSWLTNIIELAAQAINDTEVLQRHISIFSVSVDRSWTLITLLPSLCLEVLKVRAMVSLLGPTLPRWQCNWHQKSSCGSGKPQLLLYLYSYTTYCASAFCGPTEVGSVSWSCYNITGRHDYTNWLHHLFTSHH